MIPAATGYGPEGPDSHKPAFALTGEARSGSLWWGGPDDGAPYNLGSIADQAVPKMLPPLGRNLGRCLRSKIRP